MYYHSKFSFKRFGSSEDIVQIYTLMILLLLSLWPWLWTQLSNISTGHFGLWWSTSNLCLVAKKNHQFRSYSQNNHIMNIYIYKPCEKHILIKYTAAKQSLHLSFIIKWSVFWLQQSHSQRISMDGTDDLFESWKVGVWVPSAVPSRVLGQSCLIFNKHKAKITLRMHINWICGIFV